MLHPKKRVGELESELRLLQATFLRVVQEKELIERHNAWLNEQLTTKVDGLVKLRRENGELEDDMSSEIADLRIYHFKLYLVRSNFEKIFQESTSSLKLHKDRVRDLKEKLASLEKDLLATNDAPAAVEERCYAEMSTIISLWNYISQAYRNGRRRQASLSKSLRLWNTKVQCLGCGHPNVRHFCWWNKYIASPIQDSGNFGSGKEAMLFLKHKILKSIVLRRTKKGRAADLALPLRIVTLRRDCLDVVEEDYYTMLYNESQAQFNTFFVHIAMQDLFTFWPCFMLYKEYDTVTSMRLKFLASQGRCPKDFTPGIMTSALAPVVDINGDELKAGVLYNIFGAQPSAGPIAVAQGTCVVHVVPKMSFYYHFMYHHFQFSTQQHSTQ